MAWFCHPRPQISALVLPDNLLSVSDINTMLRCESIGCCKRAFRYAFLGAFHTSHCMAGYHCQAPLGHCYRALCYFRNFNILDCRLKK